MVPLHQNPTPEERSFSVHDAIIKAFVHAMEEGWLPDPLIRYGIRARCRARLKESHRRNLEAAQAEFDHLREQLCESEIAIHTEEANEQHYELPPEFFSLVLGPLRKYSSAYWPTGTRNLAEAERAALTETWRHADLKEGQEILELGCGWGSLTLWMAENYPSSQITAVSNSAPQRRFIESELKRRKLSNVQVLTSDVNQFEPDREFDRVVSVEMFEHVRNHRSLLERISHWLKPNGKLFVHIFCHKQIAYAFETTSDSDWIGRYFFTGGLMPSADLLLFYPDAMTIEERWIWDGTHYERTANSWLKNLDQHRSQVLTLFEAVYGADAPIWFRRWRVFFLACAETFGFERGQEWCVAHYRFSNARGSLSSPSLSDNAETVTLPAP